MSHGFHSSYSSFHCNMWMGIFNYYGVGKNCLESWLNTFVLSPFMAELLKKWQYWNWDSCGKLTLGIEKRIMGCVWIEDSNVCYGEVYWWMQRRRVLIVIFWLYGVLTDTLNTWHMCIDKWCQYHSEFCTILTEILLLLNCHLVKFSVLCFQTTFLSQ